MSSKTTKRLHVSWLVWMCFSHYVFFLIVDSLTDLEENGSPCCIHSCPLYCGCDLWGSCRHTIGMWFIQTNDYLISPIKRLTFPEAAEWRLVKLNLMILMGCFIVYLRFKYKNSNMFDHFYEKTIWGDKYMKLVTKYLLKPLNCEKYMSLSL